MVGGGGGGGVHSSYPGELYGLLRAYTYLLFALPLYIYILRVSLERV